MLDQIYYISLANRVEELPDTSLLCFKKNVEGPVSKVNG